MKSCTGCKLPQPEENFYWKNISKGQRQSCCKTCRANQRKQDWASGKEKAVNYANKAKRVSAAKDYVWDLLKQSKCFDCGERNPIVLEFDHISNDKHNNVSTMINNGSGLDLIKLEILKCDIVCANCHRIRTSDRGGHWKSVLHCR